MSRQEERVAVVMRALVDTFAPTTPGPLDMNLVRSRALQAVVAHDALEAFDREQAARAREARSGAIAAAVSDMRRQCFGMLTEDGYERMIVPGLVAAFDLEAQR